MSIRRDNALAALRTWSARGTRARLLAEAWDAGETTVVVLAEAARCSRQTVYTELRSMGIEPDQRPQEEPELNLAPVVIDDLDGTDRNAAQLKVEAAVAAISPDDTEGAMGAYRRYVSLHHALERYNAIRPGLGKEQRARSERDRALHLVETRWEALGTAAHWYAAHHAYVTAVHDARAAIDTWEDTATEVDGYAAIRAGHHNADLMTPGYQIILEAGHPPLDLFTLRPKAVAEQLHNELDQTHTRREQIAAETLGLASAR